MSSINKQKQLNTREKLFQLSNDIKKIIISQHQKIYREMNKNLFDNLILLIGFLIYNKLHKCLELICNSDFKKLLNTKGTSAIYPVQICVECNDLESLKILYHKGGCELKTPDIKSNEKSYESLVKIAITNNNLEIIKFLIETGYDLNEKFPSGLYALDIACLIEKEKIFKYILCYPNPDGALKSNKSAALASVKNRNFKFLKLLQQHGYDINYKPEDNLKTPLILSVEKGYEEIVEFYYENGYNFDVKIKLKQKRQYSNYSAECYHINNNDTLSHLAVQNGSLACLKIIKRANCKMFEENDLGHTPLYYAFMLNRVDCIDFLIENCTNPEQLNSGFINIAIEKNNYDTLKLLCEKKVDFTHTDAFGINPLYLAALKGYEDCYNLLTKYGFILTDENTVFNNVLIQMKEVYVKLTGIDEGDITYIIVRMILMLNESLDSFFKRLLNDDIYDKVMNGNPQKNVYYWQIINLSLKFNLNVYDSEFTYRIYNDSGGFREVKNVITNQFKGVSCLDEIAANPKISFIFKDSYKTDLWVGFMENYLLIVVNLTSKIKQFQQFEIDQGNIAKLAQSSSNEFMIRYIESILVKIENYHFESLRYLTGAKDFISQLEQILKSGVIKFSNRKNHDNMNIIYNSNNKIINLVSEASKVEDNFKDLLNQFKINLKKEQNIKYCSMCNKLLDYTKFSKSQWKNTNSKCTVCLESLKENEVGFLATESRNHIQFSETIVPKVTKNRVKISSGNNGLSKSKVVITHDKPKPNINSNKGTTKSSKRNSKMVIGPTYKLQNLKDFSYDIRDAYGHNASKSENSSVKPLDSLLKAPLPNEKQSDSLKTVSREVLEIQRKQKDNLNRNFVEIPHSKLTILKDNGEMELKEIMCIFIDAHGLRIMELDEKIREYLIKGHKRYIFYVQCGSGLKIESFVKKKFAKDLSFADYIISWEPREVYVNLKGVQKKEECMLSFGLQKQQVM